MIATQPMSHPASPYLGYSCFKVFTRSKQGWEEGNDDVKSDNWWTSLTIVRDLSFQAESVLYAAALSFYIASNEQ